MTGRYRQAEPLNAAHDISKFDCGSDSQTTWLRKHALTAHQSGTARVQVVRRVEDDAVAGYYALASGAVLHRDAPERLRKGAGRYPIPVVILARLGVDVIDQGGGLGTALVVDALRRVDVASQEIGVRALLIHSEGEKAKQFYLRLGEFEESPTDPHHLLLLMKDLRRAFGPRS